MRVKGLRWRALDLTYRLQGFELGIGIEGLVAEDLKAGGVEFGVKGLAFRA